MLAHNVGACDGRGLGGLSNGAKRNAKADQLRPVPRHNVNKETESKETESKETESKEDTKPPPDTNLLLVAVWPSPHFIRSLHSCHR
jgi:hypothetical protein